MYIHKLKYIHGDVKLENIVLDNSQKIKLVDFGFCTSYEKLEGYHWGSLLYSAPEIILKSELITPKIDTWSGGIVLFAISFGILPIRLKMGCSFEEIKTLYNKISELGPPFSDKIPRSTALKELLKKILSIDPKLRISEEEILASDWLSGSGSLHLDLGNLSLVESPLSSASPDTPEFPKKF